MLITSSELNCILDDPDLILADVRSFGEYSKGHIPGAVHLDLFAFHWIDTTTPGIESFNSQARNILSILGVSPGKKVVFYDTVSGMLAARGVWMLTYLSHGDALMLDGGISKWQRDGLRTETETNAFKPSDFSGMVNPDVITGFEYIRDNLNNLKILDVRSQEEYTGSTVRAARPGHIPGSVNIDWNRNLNDDGTLKSSSELSSIYNIPKDAKIITYCQGGYRAANSFLVLKKLGFENVRVYLGSWGEWGNRLDLPAEM